MSLALFAHRGNAAEAPENTLAAFRLVEDSGADGVEFDVQASRDGIPVVIHDERLERTTDGSGFVGALTVEELKRLDAGKWKGSRFSGERIPTLEEVLALFRGTELVVNIELKTSLVPYPGLVGRVIEAVERAGLAKRVILSSFNHLDLVQAGRIAPALPRAALISDVLIEPWLYAAAHGFQALHPEHHACTPEMARGCHALGLSLRAYTVDTEAEMRALAAMGVDGLFTNQPRCLAAARGQIRR